MAFVVVVTLAPKIEADPSAAARFLRRTYLSLASAMAAVERAERRGVRASVQLCELRPLGGAL